MIVKVISDDGSTKMVMINEKMNACDICITLAEKHHQTFEPNWTLVERLEDFELGSDFRYLFPLTILYMHMLSKWWLL